MRKKIAAGNWKMNLRHAEAMALVDAVVGGLPDDIRTEVVLAPPFVYLSEVLARIQHKPALSLAAQNCAAQVSGAFTGEVSASMLASVGTDFVIIGHSERRTLYHETDAQLVQKTVRVLEQEMIPVFCCGETLQERTAGMQFSVVKDQLSNGLFAAAATRITECVIAYEPVWAIGTGQTATPAQAQEMHQFIRTLVKEHFNASASQIIPILYGGSVTSANADELFACPDVDGGLIGGASLKPADFLAIIRSLERFA